MARTHVTRVQAPPTVPPSRRRGIHQTPRAVPGRPAHLSPLLCALALSATMVQAQPASPPNAPPANLSCPGPALAPVTEPPADREGQPVVIYAEQLQGSPNRPGEATGRVELFRADQFMATERVLVDPRTSVVTLPGPVRYQDANVRLESSGGQYGFLTESGTFEDVLPCLFRGKVRKPA